MLLEDFDESEFVGMVDKQDKENGASTSNWKIPDSVEIAAKANKDHPKGYAVVRLINPVPSSPADPAKPGTGRAKLANISLIKDSKNNWHRVIMPAYIKYKAQYPSVFLDFIDKVLSKAKVEGQETKDGKQLYKSVYEERNDYGAQSVGKMTLAEIWKMVSTCGQQQNGDIKPKTWRGSTAYIVNCIDRTDPKWHQEHKQTKLLVKEITKKGDKTYLKELPWYCIQNGLDSIRTSYETTPYRRFHCDVFIEPGAKGTDSYKFTNATKAKDTGFLDELKLPADVVKNISLDPNLTQEEMNYNVIDVEEFYAFTPSAKLVEWFGDIIGMFDSYEGTNYLELLKMEAKEEAANATASKPTVTEQPAAPEEAQSVPTQPAPEVKQPEPIQSVPSFDQMDDAQVTQEAPKSSGAPSMDDFWNTLNEEK